MISDQKRCGPVRIVNACLLIIAASPTLLAAETDAPTIAECQSIQDDAARLACYDRMAAPMPPAREMPVAPPVDEPAPAASSPSDDAMTRAVDEPASTPALPPEKTTAEAAARDAPAPAPRQESVSVAADEQAAALPARPVEPETLSDEIGRETVRGRDEDEAQVLVRGHVVDCDEGRSGKYVFYFDNGQIWLQKDNKRLWWKECEFDVTISKDFFGYKMVRDDDDRTVRIERYR